MDVPTFKAGDPLSAGKLNVLGDLARAGVQTVSGDGTRMVSLPSGTAVRYDRRPECWIKITGGGPSGIYAGTQQLEEPSGGWADGPAFWITSRSNLREANGNTAVPTGGTVIVRAWRDRLLWFFQYGAC